MRRFRDALIVSGLIVLSSHADLQIEMLKNEAATGRPEAQFAQFDLGVAFEKGDGVEQDWKQAAAWYRKAAEQHNAYAQHSIGKMYLDGEGVPQNFEKAAKWISKAAEQSHNGAFRDMGEMYWKGLGVSQNNILAYMWWKLGVLHGDKESERLLDIAAAKMKSSHVDEAQKLAQEWMQKHE